MRNNVSEISFHHRAQTVSRNLSFNLQKKACSQTLSYNLQVSRNIATRILISDFKIANNV